jgi:hypothetical protein
MPDCSCGEWDGREPYADHLLENESTTLLFEELVRRGALTEEWRNEVERRLVSNWVDGDAL